MSDDSSQSPFSLLRDLERRSIARVRGLPVQDEVREEWEGIAFQVRNHTLLASMAEVEEVISPPAITLVPWVKPWVLGLANMRGLLLPIVDLQGVLYGGCEAVSLPKQRVMVVSSGGTMAGLLVDGVSGIKHYWVDEMTSALPRLDYELQAYVHHTYRRDDEHHAVFDMARLINSELFLDVAV
jgi:twitching motility protein PilI